MSLDQQGKPPIVFDYYITRHSCIGRWLEENARAMNVYMGTTYNETAMVW